jgi:hypothetical protein
MQLAARSLYQTLSDDRSPYLRRARDCAKLTIPHILPEEGHRGSVDLYTPYQSMGARGVASLSSKLLMSLFPPSQSWFRLAVDPFSLEKVAGTGDVRTEVESALAEIEAAVHGELEALAWRPMLHEALKQLVVSGNVLCHITPDGDLKVFTLDRFVIKRDPAGSIQKIILKESIAPELLPGDLADKAKAGGHSIDRAVDVYTCINRVDPDTYEVFQEVAGEVVMSTFGTYPADKLPWLALRLEPVTGESYAYGFCAGLLGDLKSLEGLTMSLVESAAAASKVLFLVDPASPTRAETLAKSPNGAIREGRATDVSVLNLGGKAADMRIAFEAIGQIKDRLAHAFLLNSSATRQAERVTAEEVRFMAMELEGVLAGQYALLSETLQLRLSELLIDRMQGEGRLPAIPEGVVHPTIVTGLDALSRGHDLTKLDMFIQGAMATFGPELLSRHINVGDYLDRRATALGISTKGLVRTEEELEAAMQQQNMAALVQQFGPKVLEMGQEAAMSQEPTE